MMASHNEANGSMSSCCILAALRPSVSKAISSNSEVSRYSTALASSTGSFSFPSTYTQSIASMRSWRMRLALTRSSSEKSCAKAFVLRGCSRRHHDSRKGSGVQPGPGRRLPSAVPGRRGRLTAAANAERGLAFSLGSASEGATVFPFPSTPFPFGRWQTGRNPRGASSPPTSRGGRTRLPSCRTWAGADRMPRSAPVSGAQL